jgi:hypothetical protein
MPITGRERWYNSRKVKVKVLSIISLSLLKKPLREQDVILGEERSAIWSEVLKQDIRMCVSEHKEPR